MSHNSAVKRTGRARDPEGLGLGIDFDILYKVNNNHRNVSIVINRTTEGGFGRRRAIGH